MSEAVTDSKPWLTTKDVCKLTGMSDNTLRKYRREGLIPMIYIGGKYKITRDQFKRAERAIFERRGQHRY